MKKKREETNDEYQEKKRRITIDPHTLKKIIQEYFEELYINKLENLD